MAMLDENAKKEVSKRLNGLKSAVTIVYFDRKSQLNEDIKALLSEFAGLSGNIKLEMHDMEKDRAAAEKYGVELAPVMILKSAHVKGDARFYGIPSGHEFAAFLEILKMAGGELKGDEGMRKFFDSTSGIKLEVFTTPTCPHCPASAYVALKFAMMSPKVKGYVYEATEFPDVARKYQVMSVPKTVINEGRGEFVGGYAEDLVFLQIKKALSG
ncbi:thioredoxin family protein [Candidatus Micrarchaeota archaeon]|nr:thioredoxin family protein [Candidatus Micrarchaeota archaeon]